MSKSRQANSYAIGIDLGGTKIAGALVRRTGDIMVQERLPTLPEEGVEPVVERILGCIRQLQSSADGQIIGIGIGAPAMTDSRHGIVIRSSNLKWADVHLRDIIIQKMGTEWNNRIWVDKDTNAAVLGEMLYGAGQGSRHLVYITVGTGVGAGMVLDGRLYHGASQGASDIGHLVLDPQGPICGCGKRGCLETLASGPAIARLCQQALRRGETSILSSQDIEAITAHEVVDAAKQGDDLAQSILAAAGQNLGIALAYYVDINNPERIVIGGGVATAAGELLLEPARRAISERALRANAKTAQVSPASLGDASGVIGAAALVWIHHENPEGRRG